jgi:hypothetical protein
MPRFEVITDEQELLLFQEETYQRLDVRLPLDYLRRGEVTALITRHPVTRIYGGYAVITEGPFRALEQVPKEVLRQHRYLRARQSRCFEINALWLDHKRLPRFTRVNLWRHLFVSLLRTAMRGKYYFVYSFDTSKDKLRDIYAGMHPTRIFQGEVKALEGMARPTQETVEMCSFKNATLAVLANPDFFWARMKRKKPTPLASQHH